MPESIQFHGDPIESNTLYVVLDDRKAFGEPYVIAHIHTFLLPN